MNQYYLQVNHVLKMILVANLAVAILKIVIGSVISSTGMSADGFHSLTDGTSNIIAMIAIRLSSRPVDSQHPYGYNKFETLAGLLISGLLFIIAVNILHKAIDRFRYPVIPHFTLWSIIILLLTLLVNIIVSVYEYRKGRQYHSDILISDSLHTRSDIYVSIGVLLTLLGVKLGLPAMIDPLASLVICGFIFHASFEISKKASAVLLDHAATDPKQIEVIALSFEGVKDVHNIRSRGSQTSVYIDMHLMTDPSMSVEQSHHLIHRIEDRMQEALGKNTQVIAHIEPYELFHQDRY